MLFDATFEVGGFAQVENAISAAEPVHELHNDDDAIVLVMNATESD